MISEPCINQSLYTDAIAIVLAESKAQAFDLLLKQNHDWLIGDMEHLEPIVMDATAPAVIFEEVRGS
jgi:hypothetical protein